MEEFCTLPDEQNTCSDTTLCYRRLKHAELLTFILLWEGEGGVRFIGNADF